MATYIELTNRAVPDELSIAMKWRAKGREHTRDLVIRAGDLGITSAGTWIAVALLALQEKCKSRGTLNAECAFFLRVLTLVCKDEVTKLAMCAQIHTVGRAEVVNFFQETERLIASVPTWSGPSQSANSSTFRRFMVEEVPGALFAEDVTNHSRYFKTVLRERHKPRATLSDLPALDLNVPDPIGAIPHDNIQQLRESSIERLTVDIEAVKEACMYDLELWGVVRNKMRTYARQNLPREDYRHIVNFVNNRVVVGESNLLTVWDFPIQTLIGSMGRFERNFKIKRKLLTICFQKELKEKVCAKLGISQGEYDAVTFRHIAGLCTSANPRELVAAFHALQIHSGWNADALQNLTIKDIVPSDNGYLVRSIKGKVDKFTPQVFIGPGERGAWLAINLLIWNYSQLKRRKLIEKDEGRLWFCWSNSEDVMTQPYAMHKAKVAMLMRHGIAWFSDEQIRNHVLTLISMRRRNGLVDAQAVAGHSYIGTTAHYADQLVTKLMCDSINLEFQRRLDSTLKIALWGPHSDFVMRLRFQKFDAKLALPVGDGTLCAAPENPPDLDWLAGGVCDAKRCHTGQGCKNNRIAVTQSSVEELWRFVQYYKGNWQRLLAENDAAFREYHGPAMLFALAFIRFLQDSPYWEEVKIYLPHGSLR
ncbi:hypothetical protein BJN34_01890 [Cupriavidus necator]|uniref:Uncharacterized protein n=1 Tax=Cupriavidus necator TaxID=106590 RepID=A0A1U9UK35_CUPNE|nr:hypothetical protein [Cupriavidus necator]AQV92641.1 hypothetical protein BJN34_01890 [Cupriavidus necator]